MNNRARHLGLVSAGLILCLAFSATAFADAHERVQFGRNITIGPGEEVSEATCFGCSIRVQGHVAGDATVFCGSVIVQDQGQVGGDLTDFAGNVRIEKAATVGGGVTVFGGQIHRDPAAIVGGDVTVMGGSAWIWIALIVGLPIIVLALFIVFVVWLVRRLMRPAVPATA